MPGQAFKWEMAYHQKLEELRQLSRQVLTVADGETLCPMNFGELKDNEKIAKLEEHVARVERQHKVCPIVALPLRRFVLLQSVRGTLCR